MQAAEVSRGFWYLLTSTPGAEKAQKSTVCSCKRLSSVSQLPIVPALGIKCLHGHLPSCAYTHRERDTYTNLTEKENLSLKIKLRWLHGLECLLCKPEDLDSNSYPHKSRAWAHIPGSPGHPSWNSSATYALLGPRQRIFLAPMCL